MTTVLRLSLKTHKLIGRQRQLSTHEATLMVVGCQIVGDVDVTKRYCGVYDLVFSRAIAIRTPGVVVVEPKNVFIKVIRFT